MYKNEWKNEERPTRWHSGRSSSQNTLDSQSEVSTPEKKKMK